jgi:hypothetical protein
MAAFRAISSGGLVAGILDITYAFVFYGSRGVGPDRILQSIASGVMGRAAYEGGAATALLGGALHFLIAFAAAAVYYAASRRIPLLVRRPYVSGTLYGFGLYLFMNLVVLPLSAFPGSAYSSVAIVTGLLVHMLLIGIPISLSVRRHAGETID